MRSVLIVTRRELAAYVGSAVAPVFLIVFLILTGVLTFNVGGLFERERADLNPLFTALPWVLLLLVPALSMRLWSEERRTGTQELLLTLPLPIGGVVIGKWLAAVLVSWLGIALTAPAWVTVSILGDPDHGAIASGYVAAGALSAVLMAIGAAASAATRSQVVAFVVGAAIGLVLLLAGYAPVVRFLDGYLPPAGVEAMLDLSALQRFQSASSGLLTLSDAVYVASLVCIALLINTLLVAPRQISARGFTGSITLAAVCGITLNLAAAQWLGGVRVDATADRVHTLSPGARAIAQGLDRRVRLTLFYSSGVAAERPEIVAHAGRVRTLLRTMAEASEGMILIEEVDPEPFSAAEDRAIAAGIAPVQSGDGFLYFGLAGSNDLDAGQLISFLDPIDAPRTEYAIAQAVMLLGRTDQPRLGLITDLPIDGLFVDQFTRSRGYAVRNELARFFAIERIEPDAERMPEELDALAVFHAKSMSGALQSDVQRRLRGGLPVLVAVDPLCEADITQEIRDDPRLLADYDRSSSIPELFAEWGVGFDTGVVVADRARAVTVTVDQGGRRGQVPYVLRSAHEPGSGLASTQRLSRVVVSTPGVLTLDSGSRFRATPLLTTSADSTLIPTRAVRFGGEPQSLLDAFEPDAATHDIALALESDAGEQLFVLADADLLTDALWITPRRVGGRVVGANRTADNAEFIVGLLAEATASTELLAIAPRSSERRAFDRVVAMRTQAQREFEQTQSEMRAELETLEQRLRALIDLRSGLGGRGGFLAEEQRQELRRIEATRAELRDRLRTLRFELNRDIESLGARVRLINTFAAAIAVALAAGILGFWRRRVRIAERRAHAKGAA